MSKLLSQGSFGCVYYPSLNCQGSPDLSKDFLSKLQKKDFNSENEKNIGKKIIENIPNYKKYFVPVLSACDINISEIDRQEIQKCNVVKKNVNFPFELQKMKYVNSKSILSFVNESSSPRKIIFNVIELYTFLLHSIEMLANNEIVHFDLKNNNILFGLQAKTPLIIDFGISIDMSKLINKATRNQYLGEYFYVYAPQYYIWPLEVHFINFLVHVKPVATITDIQELCKTFVTENKGLEMFSPEFKQKYYKTAVDFLSKYANNTSKDSVIAELLSFFKTWDNYTLSVMYLNILFAIFNDKIPKKTFISHFSELLTFNIHPNPSKRHSISNSLKIFHKIFYKSNNPDEYLQLLTNYSFDRKLAVKTIKKDDTVLKLLYNKHINKT